MSNITMPQHTLLLFLIALVANVSAADGSQRVPSQETESADTDSSILVDAAWVADAIKNKPNVRIIDLAMDKDDYQKGHIPGAVFFDWRSDIIDAKQKDWYRLPQKKDLERLLSKAGIKSDQTVVVTDNLFNRTAVRMYYTLKYYGHKDVRILNGGTPIWAASKRKLSTETPEYSPSKYEIKTERDEYLVHLKFVRDAVEGKNCQLIDGRPRDQYSGEVAGRIFHIDRAHDRLGHIPTAASIPWVENLNEDGTFKSVKELRTLYESHGIDVNGKVVTYCNEGLHAALPWFVFRELFGNSEARLYDNSLAEWANRDDTPLKMGKDR